MYTYTCAYMYFHVFSSTFSFVQTLKLIVLCRRTCTCNCTHALHCMHIITVLHVLSIIFHIVDTSSKAALKQWKATWSEVVPGEESCVRLYLPQLVSVASSALQSQSWSIKSQGAAALATIAEKMGMYMYCTVCVLGRPLFINILCIIRDFNMGIGHM